MADSSWVNLLSNDIRQSSPTPSVNRGVVKVSDHTPKTADVPRRTMLQTSHEEACHKLEEQAQLIARLASDNANLISQLESLLSVPSQLATDSDHNVELSLKAKEQTIQGLMAHIRSLRQEFKIVSSKLLSPHNTSGLLDDLERLTHKNADLCSSLAATQYSRNILEREIIVLKRTLLQERSKVPACAKGYPQVKLDYSLDEALRDEEMESLKVENANLKHQIETLRSSQLKEIEHRCNEVDTLKLQLSDQLNVLQKDHDMLSCKLTEVATEKKCLLQKLRDEEERNHLLATKLAKHTYQLSELKSCALQQTSQVEKLEAKNSSLHSELAHVQMRMQDELQQEHSVNSELKEQVKNLDSKLKCILSELKEVNHSNCTFKQQLCQFDEEVRMLKTRNASLSKLNSELKMVVDQRNCMIQHLEEALQKQTDKCNALLNCSSETMGDIVNLKQRLTDARQFNVRLEVQLAQLKTDNAKLSGSYQAIISVRNQLSQDNKKLQDANRELRSEKALLTKEKEDYSSRVNDMSAYTVGLDSSLVAVKSELSQVSKTCRQRQDQLDQYKMKLNGEVRELSDQLNYFQFLVDTEVGHLGALTCEYEEQVSAHQQQLLDMMDNIRICGSVNSTRICQIEMCDESVIRLQGELEVMRARKTVLLCMSQESTCDVSAASHPTILFADCSLVAKLRHKLKQQKKQANFLRVKLGYTLSELRLYKQLKDACDKQLSGLEGCLEDVQRQYQQCAARLAAAEQQLIIKHKIKPS